MPNIFKRFSQPEAKPYQFPKADELIVTNRPEFQSPEEEAEAVHQDPPEEPPENNFDPEAQPVSYAQVQAELIMQDAKKRAEVILDKARADARSEAETIYEQARSSGYQDGYAQGTAQALEDGIQIREEQAAALEAEVVRFLERAGEAVDRQLDQNLDELRDLAMAIAEKVVCISLKSSTEVISRMIQTALDKRKHREWVHIYIAECDAKRMAQIPSSLSSTLSALADRVRIIPMTDEESGTCIIEMPDEIIDASAGTQLNNIRNILMDTPSGRTGDSIF